MTQLRLIARRVRARLARSSGAARLAVRVRHQANQVISQHLTASKDPEHNGEHWLLSQLGRIGVVVDIGANVGDWTARVLETSPAAQAIVIEPGELAASRLQDRFGDRSNVTIHAVAAGEVAGHSDFWEQPDAGVTSSLVGDYGIADRVAPRRVEVAALADILEAEQISHIDLLKIDAEGFDYFVLLGAARFLRDARIDVIQFEYNQGWEAAGATLSSAARLLESFGYRLMLLQPCGVRPYSPREFGEFFLYANFVAVNQQGRRYLGPELD